MSIGSVAPPAKVLPDQELRLSSAGALDPPTTSGVSSSSGSGYQATYSDPCRALPVERVLARGAPLMLMKGARKDQAVPPHGAGWVLRWRPARPGPAVLEVMHVAREETTTFPFRLHSTPFARWDPTPQSGPARLQRWDHNPRLLVATTLSGRRHPRARPTHGERLSGHVPLQTLFPFGEQVGEPPPFRGGN